LKTPTGDLQFDAPVQDFIKLLGTALIDLTWVAHAPLVSMATISIQDDANMVRYRPLFEPVKDSVLVNPIKKTHEQRSGRALIRARINHSPSSL
jgi:hypothetical protein